MHTPQPRAAPRQASASEDALERRDRAIVFALGLLFLVAGSVGVYLFTNVTRRIDELHYANLEGAVSLAAAENALWRLRYGFPQFLVLGPEDRAKIVAEEPKLYAEIAKSVDGYRARATDPDELAALRNWDERYEAYHTMRPHWFELISAGKMEEAARWRAEYTTPRGAAAVQALADLIKLQQEVAGRRYAEVAETARFSSGTLIVVM